MARAAAWALRWLTEWGNGHSWLSTSERDRLVGLCEEHGTDRVVRQRLLAVLGNVGDSRALDLARRALEGDDDDPLLLSAAVRVVGLLGPEDGFDLVNALVNNPDHGLRRTSAVALGELGDARALPLLISLLSDEDDGVKSPSAYALGALLDTTGVSWHAITGHPVPDQPVSEAIAGNAVDALIGCLHGESSPRVQSALASALGRAGAVEALDVLKALLLNNKAQAGVRRSAASAVAAVGGSHAIPALDRALDDGDVRGEAAWALAGIDNSDAAKVLTDRLASGDTDLVDLAARTISRLGAEDRMLLLQRMAAPSNPLAVRRAVTVLAGNLLPHSDAEELEGRGPTAGKTLGRVSGLLLSLLRDHDVDVRHEAVESLRKAYSIPLEDLQSLLEQSTDAAVRRFAVSRLSDLPGDEPASALSEALSDEDPEIVKTALDGLHGGRAAVARPSIRRLLEHPTSAVREAAVRTLATDPEDEDLDFFASAISDPEATVLQEAVQGLARWLAVSETRQLQAALRDSRAPHARENYRCYAPPRRRACCHCLSRPAGTQ